MITLKIAAGALCVAAAIGLLMPPIIGGLAALGLPLLAVGVGLCGIGVLDATEIE